MAFFLTETLSFDEALLFLAIPFDWDKQSGIYIRGDNPGVCIRMVLLT
jgi:hypothetical protein